VEKLPEFFKMIYETALAIKPDAVVEICPCGTAYAFHTMPYMNQPVSSDPMSSWQIRLKGKTFKALMGRDAPYYGDHVELSDNGTDFASTVGVGAVVGTKFTWPDDRHEHDNYVLTPEKEKHWKKWVDIYQQEMLPRGQYLGTLYDIGYDRPETHVVRKSDTLYYAFYAEQFDGTIDLRGLNTAVATYDVIDYVRGEKLGTVATASPELTTSFEDHLLIKCLPVD
jgi:alpha-galactosidase